MTTTREELYLKTGFTIMEVIAMVARDEINILRAEHGLPARTKQQVKIAIENKLKEYDWEDFIEEE